MTQKNSPAEIAIVGTRKSRLGMVVGGLCLVAICFGLKYLWGNFPASAEDARRPTATSAATTKSPTKASAPKGRESADDKTADLAENAKSQLKVVAAVNGTQVTREQLAQECLLHHGKEVCDSLVNKHLIVEACRQRSIKVTRGEVDAEVERMAQRFSLPVDQWFKLLKQERGITPSQYAADVIWPTLALRKLAGAKLAVTAEELREAYDANYGPSIRCRLISLKDKKTAQKVQALAKADPDSFGDLAKQYSEDASASVKGVIPPLRRSGSFKDIETAAFRMTDGEVSPVIAIAGQYVIIKREAEIPGATSVAYNKVAPQLEEIVREKKLRGAAGDIFKQLQSEAKVEVIFNDPAKSAQMPGVVAIINDQPIAMKELTDQCLERYAEQVLEGTISRLLIEQACKNRNVTVSKREIDEEIAREAADMVPLKADKTPDVETWLKMVTEQQKVSIELYRRDAVWPAVALRKLVGDDVKVTGEDIQKGFEANYGPRVRCRAIITSNARRAQEVWDLARKKLTVENFGALAEQYSVEPGSQALRGEVPPIKRNGGQPLLEKEAFALKPGELSGIIQVEGKFVILFCEGFTEPIQVDIKEVRSEIYKDLFDKKQQLAMTAYFDRLKDNATIDNYLAGTSQSPNSKSKAPDLGSELPALKQLSGNQLRRPTAAEGSKAVKSPLR